ncbi:hypothetical protein A9Q84_01535 [Halobacteriovorax marinus]|uniref:MAPEG family protein n=1 Tax=Halobacteriovorax marinus TaxID=97084 RepID=A0A1Y5FC81_9BACT|nr:hypothetical protein A9Q84_01535 [Halobacteriovorax marinus]
MMNQNLIFVPCFILMMTTASILCLMFVRRIKSIKCGDIKASHYKTYDSGDSEPRLVIQASRNFSNLHESPTLFYVLCLFSLVTSGVDQVFLYLSWGYVTLRMIHTLVHVTSNKINPRLLAYGLSWVVLVTMAIKTLININ